jgi:hypothetical protein
MVGVRARSSVPAARVVAVLPSSIAAIRKRIERDAERMTKISDGCVSALYAVASGGFDCTKV